MAAFITCVATAERAIREVCLIRGNTHYFLHPQILTEHLTKSILDINTAKWLDHPRNRRCRIIKTIISFKQTGRKMKRQRRESITTRKTIL
jgi:hypothetical protein